MRSLSPPRLWNTIVLTLVVALAATPSALANYAPGETCVNVSHANRGTHLDVAVQNGHSYVIMVMTNEPAGGAAVAVTVSPNACAVESGLGSLISSAEAPPQVGGVDALPILP